MSSQHKKYTGTFESTLYGPSVYNGEIKLDLNHDLLTGTATFKYLGTYNNSNSIDLNLKCVIQKVIKDGVWENIYTNKYSSANSNVNVELTVKTLNSDKIEGTYIVLSQPSDFGMFSLTSNDEYILELLLDKKSSMTPTKKPATYE